MQTSQENYRRGTPVTPGGAFQQNSGWTNYNIPPPPPIQQQQGQVGSAMYPPPPPRLPMGGPQHFVPPPPGQGGYTAWNRQGPYAMPSNASQTREPRAYDPSLYHGYEGFNQNLPADNQPLTSATYIPGGESFGPGVGIPPLHTHSVSLNSPPTRTTVSPPQHEYYRGQSYDGNTNMGRYNSDSTFNDAPGAWYPGGTWQPLVPSQSAPPQQVSQSLPPPTPTTARQKTLILPAKETEQHKSPSQEHNNTAFGFGNALNSDTIMGEAPASPDDAWPTERVQGFLAANNFSREWQDAFLHLNVRGAQFLDIGRAPGGDKRGNIGFMRLTVLPQVARECTANNVMWDQTKEHDQGKRLRRLVRAVVKYGGAVSTPQSSTNSLPLKTGRSPSNNFNSGSAGTDGGVESSPNLSRPEGNIWSAGGDAEDLPTRGMSTRIVSGQRAATFDSAGSNTALNDAGRSQYSQHALGHFASDIVRRHSPSTSSDLGSPALHAARPSNSGSGLGHGRVGHLRGNNSDTNITLSTASSSSTALRDKAIHTPQDSSRSSSEAGKGSETPASAKERKGLFHKLGRRNKKESHDSVMPSPPDEEPASPHNSKQTPYSIQRSASSETSLAERSNSRKSKGQLSVDSVSEISGHASHGSERQFIFVTPDCWNYRLIDVTDIESADQLRTAICFNLQIDESPDVAIYLTSPGQLEHEELLDDSSLVTIRKRMADSTGSLKLMVRAPYIMNGQPQSAGLGVMGLPTSPFSNALLQGRFHNDGTGLQSSVDSPGTLGSGESTLVPDKFRNIRMLQKDSPTSAIPDKMRFDQKAAEHRKDTESKRDAFGRRESLFVDHNGKLIHDFDRGRSTSNERDRQNARPASSGSADFERRTDSFQPMRKAPPVPEPTSTLVKANSLSKRNSTLGRTTWPSRKDDIWKRNSNDPIPEEHPGGKGIGAAIASISQAVGAVGHPNSAPAISSSLQNSLSAANSDSLQTSKGGQTFKVPGYNEGDGISSGDTLKAGAKPNLSLKMPPNTSSRNTQRDGKSYSPNLSPGSRNPPNTTLARMQSKRGPSFDVPESQIQFESSFDTFDDSDEDSDDGLFAIPLANQKQKTSAPRVPPKAAAILGVKTDTPIRSPNKATIHAKSSRSNVKFDPPTTTGRKNYSIDEGNERSNQYYGSVSSSTTFAPSPLDDATRFGRRESFASDVWANRPPVEGIAEHLDEFFPNVDLDQPMGEDVDGGEASPVDRANIPSKPSLSDLSMSRGTAAMSNHDHDTTGGAESTFKRNDLASVAQRSMRRQGGLGRTKSIRDVVKNNYQSGQNPQNASISSQGSSRVPSGQGLPIMLQNHPSNRLSTLRNDGGIVRRKSTKMFGAKIEQVKTRPGSRLIQNLDPIPQDSIPKGNLHQHRQERQPTFKWMKGQLIGKGTFGRVYLGMNTTTGELLAVKQVEVNQNIANADPAKIREMVKALDMEIDTMQHLDHMNIVQYLGCERKEYSISIFLEYISGGSIGSCLRKHGKFEESVVSSLTRQTLSGLRYLHSECILHRDLKADNILLDLDGTCKISDFGISKKSEDPYNNDITNSMQGSVFWMAPEVIRAQSSMAPSSSDHAANMSSGYSAKVDIWSLGCVVLEMFAGRRPWSKEEAIGAIYKLGSLNQAPPIPDDVSSVIRPTALSFMLDCFTINPGDRPTADTLLHAPFCELDPHYNFLDTELYAKIRGAF